MKKFSVFVFHRFHEEGYGAKSVVAGEHGGVGIFHPSVVEIAATLGKRLHVRGENAPRRRAKALGALGILGSIGLVQFGVAGVGNGVFIRFDQLGIRVTGKGCDLYFFYICLLFSKYNKKSTSFHARGTVVQ